MGSQLAQAGSVVPLDLTVDREGIGGVTGLTPAQVTVALRDASTLGSYLDWADNIFKLAGWTTKYAGLTEVERGHYQRSFDSSLVPSVVSGSVLAAEFRADDGAVIKGDDLDLVVFVHDLSTDKVAASFAFHPTTLVLDGNVWLERNGELVAAVTACSADFYSSAGVLLFSLADAAPDAQGVFRITSGASPAGFVIGAEVYIRLIVTAPSGTFVSVKGLQVAG
jgi:hypothetical protein